MARQIKNTIVRNVDEFVIDLLGASSLIVMLCGALYLPNFF